MNFSGHKKAPVTRTGGEAKNKIIGLKLISDKTALFY
jgi:hypothetical protein